MQNKSKSNQGEGLLEGKDYDRLVKLLVIGDSGVGKTSLISRYVDDTFKDNYINTVGIDFKIKELQLQQTHVKLQLWDTAGHQRFHTITAGYYRGANGLLVVFDLTTPESFHSLQYWLRHIEDNCEKDILKIIVGTKCDLQELRSVDMQLVAALCEQLGLVYIEASSKTGKNVDELFETMTGMILDKLQKVKVLVEKGTSLESSMTKEMGRAHRRCHC